jgi:hypothetical protein
VQLNFVMFFSPSGSWPIILETTDWDQQVKGGASTAIVALHSALFDPGLILLVSPSLRQSKELFSKVIGFLRGLEPAEVLDKDNKSSCTLGNGAKTRSFCSTHHRRRRSGPASPSASATGRCSIKSANGSGCLARRRWNEISREALDLPMPSYYAPRLSVCELSGTLTASSVSLRYHTAPLVAKSSFEYDRMTDK